MVSACKVGTQNINSEKRPIKMRPCLLLLTTFLIAGCGENNRFDAVENRINSAKPLSSGTQAARQLFLAQTTDQPNAQKAMEALWVSRMRLRALNCSRDYTPTWRDSAADISSRLSNNNCFADTDRELQQWLGLQRVRLMLAQGALRPPPQSLPEIVSHREPISHLVLASEAPVAIIVGRSGFDAIDLGTSKRIFRDTTSQISALEMSLAPNGRLFAQKSAGKVLIRATEGGETVLEIPNANGVVWLDNNVLAVRTTENKALKVLDLETGDETPMPGVSDGWGTMAIRAPGAANRFNLLLQRGAVQIEILDRTGGREAQLNLEQKTTSGFGFAPSSGGASADGSLWIDGGQGMRVLNLETLELQELFSKPIQTIWACPTPNTEEFVIAIALPNDDGITSSFRQFLYSHRAGTMALVPSNSNSSSKYEYIRSIKRNAMIDNNLVRFFEKLPAGDPRPVATVVADLTDEFNQLRLAVATKREAAARGLMVADGSAIPQSVGGASVLQGQLNDAQVEGVGVYEAGGPRSGTSYKRQAGVVEVRVRRSSRPIALVLSSYEPVRWMIITEPGSRLAAVMVSGYHDSSVVGAGSARVYQIGQGYAYGQLSPGYGELQRTVTRWTGKPIGVFQGRYHGSSFSVGGS
jgi:hypothetical protein